MSRYQIIGIDMAERRRNRRSALPPVIIEFDQEAYPTVNWSLGGFLVEPYSGRRRSGERLAVTIVVTVGGKEFRHGAKAKVVWRRRDVQQLAAHFHGLPPEAVATLDGLVTGRLRRLGR